MKEKAADNKKRKKKQRQPRASKRAATKTNTTAPKTSADTGRKYELFGLLFVAAGLIGLCGLLGFNVGFIGITFADTLRYLFGWAAFPAVVLLLVGGTRCLIKHTLVKFTARFWIVSFLVICMLSILHHFVAASGQEILPNVLPEGGGLLGGIALFFIRKLFGFDGGIIVLSVLFVALVLLATNWSIAIGYLTTKRQAKKGIVKTKEGFVKTKEVLEAAGQKAGEKAVILEEIVIEPIRDRIKTSFYNQDADASFREEPLFKRSDYENGTVTAASATEAQHSDVFHQETMYPEPPYQEYDSAYEVEMAPSNEAEDLSMADRIIANRAIVSQYRPQPNVSFSQGAPEGIASPPDGMADRFAVQAVREEQEPMPQVSIDAAVEPPSEDLVYATDERGSIEIPQDTIISSSLTYDFDTVISSEDSATLHATTSYADELSDKRVHGMTTALSMSAIGEGVRMNSLGEVVSENRAADGAAHMKEPVSDAEKTYELPSVSAILKRPVKNGNAQVELEMAEKEQILAQTLEDFKVKAHISDHKRGPAVTRYEVEPAPGVKVSKITNLAEDIALNLAATAVRIEPIPGKAAIGIEVPNAELSGVRIREVLETRDFLDAKSKLTVGLGIDIGGETILADIGKMPHLLVAGSTGSGKSVCINTLITSILFKAKPDEVKFILIDPKMVELSNYNGIPHLMVPVVTDAKKAAAVLNWSVLEMEKRYTRFANAGVRDMARYNASHPEDKMPAIVIIIDELADLMMVAARDVEDAIARLTAKARAAGIHLILATQRPSVDVITGTIKNNVPSRIAFAVSSLVDSRTILDAGGAEKLLGKGDMLFSPIGANKPKRVQGAFISDEEVEALLNFIRSQGQPVEENEEIIAYTENAVAEDEDEDISDGDGERMDELLGKALEIILNSRQASTSNVQRRLRIGYTRAARIIDTLEELRIVGPAVGSKPREILMTADEAMAIVEAKLGG